MKVLVCGIVPNAAAWQTLLDRVNQLHTSKHGPFDLLLVLPGSVPKPSLTGEFPLPVVTSHSEESEARSHLQGLKVEFVSSQRALPITSCDVLLSEALPGDNCGVPNAFHTDVLAATWALATRPRYHFAGGAHNFFQRAPYRNLPNKREITRLISLCPVDALSKEKWIHALNIPPTPALSGTEPAGTTDCPYIQAPTAAKQASAPMAPPQQFFFAQPPPSQQQQRQDSTSNKRARTQGGSNAIGQRSRPATTTGPGAARLDCWFCLAASTCEKHLIVHVEEECYLALPKGGIQLEHVLLVPISHQASFAGFLSANREEVLRLIQRVQRMFAQRGLGIMLTDRSLIYGKAAQQHAYLEILPVPLAKLGEALPVFQQASKELDIDFAPLASPEASTLDDQLVALGKEPESQEYLYVCLPGDRGFIHYKQVSTTAAAGGKGEDANDNAQARSARLQFGRALCITLCGLPKEKIHWKACVQSRTDEMGWAKEFGKYWKETD